ncbi:MAG: hypothetical protein HQM10_03730 [Candidatus Riflebacteria bacterium]|nr:hypothetical protein [Candidatus Riflebacteria bacterium]
MNKNEFVLTIAKEISIAILGGKMVTPIDTENFLEQFEKVVKAVTKSYDSIK